MTPERLAEIKARRYRDNGLVAELVREVERLQHEQTLLERSLEYAFLRRDHHRETLRMLLTVISSTIGNPHRIFRDRERWLFEEEE